MDYENQLIVKYLREISENQEKTANRLLWIKWILLVPIILTFLFWFSSIAGLAYLLNSVAKYI